MGYAVWFGISKSRLRRCDDHQRRKFRPRGGGRGINNTVKTHGRGGRTDISPADKRQSEYYFSEFFSRQAFLSKWSLKARKQKEKIDKLKRKREQEANVDRKKMRQLEKKEQKNERRKRRQEEINREMGL